MSGSRPSSSRRGGLSPRPRCTSGATRAPVPGPAASGSTCATGSSTWRRGSGCSRSTTGDRDHPPVTRRPRRGGRGRSRKETAVEAAPRKAESRPTSEERRPPAAPEDTSIAAPDEQDTVERLERLEALEQQLWDE